MKRSWIRHLFTRPAIGPIRKAPHRVRLVLDALEDRTVPTTLGLKALWQAENNTTDAVGGHHGTLELGAGYAAGHDGQAFSFDGNGACVSVPYNADFDGTSGFSVVAWIKPGVNGGSEDQIVSKSDHGVPSGWEFRRYGNQVEFTLKSTSGAQYAALGSGLQIGDWNLVAGTWDQATLKVYINGTLVATKATAGSMTTNTYPLRIGENRNLLGGGGEPQWGAFLGLIDDVRYYDRALTAVEVQSLMFNVTATISGTVFVDVDGDGAFDGGTETGIDGVTVELLDSGGAVLDSDLTDLGGVYAFTVDDEFGSYSIREIQPTGVTNGAAILGSAPIDTVLSANEMQLTLAGGDASDYDFTEGGGGVQAGDTASIGFWQNKHGQALINQGGATLVSWLTTNFGNVFGNTFSNGGGGDNAVEVASFYKNEFFKKKLQGTPKVDAQFMATALATFFTSSNLSGGSVATGYGFNVTATGIGTKVVDVGSSGAAFDVANNTSMTVMALLLATNNLTGANANGYSNVYDTNGDGVLDAAELTLRDQANAIYSAINEGGDI